MEMRGGVFGVEAAQEVTVSDRVSGVFETVSMERAYRALSNWSTSAIVGGRDEEEVAA